MKLADYLEQHQIRLDVFASEIGVHISTAYRIRDGLTAPRLDTLLKIMEATGGEVGPADFVGLVRPPKADGSQGRPRTHA